LTAVSCASASLCLAVDEEGRAIVYTAHGPVRHWAAPVKIDAHRLTAVACTSLGVCLVGDDAGGTVLYDHGKFAHASSAVPLGAIQGVACVRPSTCVAVDAASTATAAVHG